MNLCVIPARGGSKRIPRKNIRLFAGKPMIAYAIQAAHKSGLFSRIVVSTDNEEVRKVSLDFGADVPFLRPAKLADDFTPTVPVVAHAIQALEAEGGYLSYVCCIYPCVPFIMENDLEKSLSLLMQANYDYSFPVSEYHSPIQRALKLGLGGHISHFHPEYELSRTQDLEPAYHDAGQFYWGSKKAWLSNQRIYSSAVGLKIPRSRVVDIDTQEDWENAEVLLRMQVSDKNKKQ